MGYCARFHDPLPSHAAVCPDHVSWSTSIVERHGQLSRIALSVFRGRRCLQCGGGQRLAAREWVAGRGVHALGGSPEPAGSRDGSMRTREGTLMPSHDAPDQGEAGKTLEWTRGPCPCRTTVRADRHLALLGLNMRQNRQTLQCRNTPATQAENARILLANLFQGSRSTLSRVSFPSVFAFQAGMWGTLISTLLNSPTD